MDNFMEGLEASVQEKIEGDTEFQATLEDLSEEEKTDKIAERTKSDVTTAVNELDTKATKAEEVAGNQKIRAEKAEDLLKNPKGKGEAPKTPPKEEARLSDKDVIYLSKADIHEDDVEEVTKYASNNKVTMKEAHEYLKPILDVRTEERTTAEATNTKKGGRGGSKQDGESLLKKAEETGEVPTDEAGMMKLAEARMARLKQNK